MVQAIKVNLNFPGFYHPHSVNGTNDRRAGVSECKEMRREEKNVPVKEVC